MRQFLNIAWRDGPPGHSSVSRRRRPIDIETHEAVFTGLLQRLANPGLLKNRAVGIHATAPEATATLRPTIRGDTGERDDAFGRGLAAASGLPTATRGELALLDPRRTKKASTDE